MYVCVCHAVTEREVSSHVREGADSADAVAERTGASTGCGSCRERLCGLVAAVRGAHSAHAADAAASVA